MAEWYLHVGPIGLCKALSRRLWFRLVSNGQLFPNSKFIPGIIADIVSSLTESNCSTMVHSTRVDRRTWSTVNCTKHFVV